MTGAIDLRLGRYQDQLEHETWDTAILDLPFSRRTHEGHNSTNTPGCFINKIDYESIDDAGVAAAVDFLAPRTRGWLISMTSHDLIPAWEQALGRHARYMFATLPYVDWGKAPRVFGDGPASWTIFIVVSRPRTSEFVERHRSSRKGRGLSTSLPGAYQRAKGDTIYKPAGKPPRIGAKPIGVMRELVRDYSAPGERVCDPTTGHATTPIAGMIEGRETIGVEVDPDAYAIARSRIALGHTPDMFAALVVPPGTEEPSKCTAVGCENGRATLPRRYDGRKMKCGKCGGSGLDPNGDLPGAPGDRT